MSFTAGSLYRDTGNFFRHQLVTIVLMSLLVSFITVLIGHALTPSLEQLVLLTQRNADPEMSLLEIVQSLSPEQQQLLLRASAAGTFASLIGNTILLGGMLSLIPMVTAGERVSALRAIGASAPTLPRLLLLVFIMTLVIQLGFTALLVPGVALAVLLALSPVILATEKVGIFGAMRISMRLAWGQIKVVFPAVVIWLLAKIAILVLISKMSVLPVNIASVVINALGNLISAILIIYLYRLYMLLRESLKTR